MVKHEANKTTVLLSGGMDSMACIYFYKDNQDEVDGVFIDYGQKSVAGEEKAARTVADYFNISFSKISVQGLAPLISDVGFIQGRNMAFLLLALMHIRAPKGKIALGIHSETGYSDCSPEFVDLSQKVLDLYTNGNIQIDAPFLTWDKVDIAVFCNINRLPVELTYSCELGLVQPCGKCRSCNDLLTLEM